MTNEKKAKEITNIYFEHVHDMMHVSGRDAKEVCIHCAELMAKWKEQQMIEKAVEWLKENTSCYVSFDDDIISDTENKNNFIKDFKKAMKGE